ncbi:hypothetical protein Nepgr_019975 [Nepenthes gracilis]|uniref:Uncharacterized protein n=1 Tax=Nepenthes gracilis TaxID=150966 RepID=A0AAD3XVK8_NEPGR|nr:hypothetical protein Nepgr_019975 [Nepenthes gracilis]
MIYSHNKVKRVGSRSYNDCRLFCCSKACGWASSFCCRFPVNDLNHLRMIDSKFGESGLGNGETDLSLHDKKFPLAVKKTPLRDLQNKNNIIKQKSDGNSPFPKEEGAGKDGVKVSSTKRPPSESPVNPSHHQSPCSSGANGHLVYVRRKFETEVGKNSIDESTCHQAECLQPRKLYPPEDAIQQKAQLKESRIPCFSAFAAIPTASLMTIPSGKPSIPSSLGKSTNTSAVHTSDQKRMTNQNWQERYLEMQMLLRKLDHSSQEDYLHMLRSLSSVELSRHAVELEKRAIQLSLEEGKELQRFNMTPHITEQAFAGLTHTGSLSVSAAVVSQLPCW